VKLLGRLAQYDAALPWEHAFVRRAADIRSMIEIGQTDKAVDQLKQWRRESLSALHIEPK